jgi:tetratricopeptide (TPR) repeat protein
MQEWALAGAPKGRGGDLQAPTIWTQRSLGTPDLVARMPESFELPADGPDVFRTFVIPIHVDTLRFIKALEFQPGNTRAVHHATILVDKTPISRQRDEEDPAPGYDGGFAPTADYPDGHFLGWAPGQQLPPNGHQPAWRLDPGSDLVIQLHLKPTGKPAHVRVTVGLFFTPDPPLTTLSMLRLAREDIDIPSGARNHIVTDSFELPAAVDVYAVQPHAHYRATKVEAFAKLADGKLQWLISIPEWDFDWQDMYYFREPLHLPKGSTLSMQYTFDNSADNPRNPQLPPRRVRWGQDSTDEMAELLVQLVPRSPDDRALLEGAFLRKHRRDVIAGYETRLSISPDAVRLHDDVAQLYMEEGGWAAASAHLRESVRLMPHSAPRQVNLGRAVLALGHIEEATAAFEEALRIAPDDVAARTDLGVALALQGRVDDAVAQYRAALETDPTYVEAHNNLSTALLYLRRTDEALDHASRALALQPDFPAAHYNMARVMLARDLPQEARPHFEQALKLRPDWPAALKDYAWMLGTDPDSSVRNPPRAIELASRAVELTDHRQPALLDILAAAYASAGRFEEAVTAAQAALTMFAGEANKGEAAIIQQRLVLYRAQKPFVDTTRHHDP